MLGIEKLDVMVDPSNVELLPLDKSSKGARTYHHSVFNSAVSINNSLCTYYKMLWCKCRKLLSNKYMHFFWVTNGTIKLKTIENGRVYAVTHRNDLVELFPDNDILADQV